MHAILWPLLPHAVYTCMQSGRKLAGEEEEEEEEHL